MKRKSNPLGDDKLKFGMSTGRLSNPLLSGGSSSLLSGSLTSSSLLSGSSLRPAPPKFSSGLGSLSTKSPLLTNPLLGPTRSSLSLTNPSLSKPSLGLTSLSSRSILESKLIEKPLHSTSLQSQAQPLVTPKSAVKRKAATAAPTEPPALKDSYEPRYEALEDAAWLLESEEPSAKSPKFSVEAHSVLAEEKAWKLQLINKVACSLIEAPNFKDPKNETVRSFRDLLVDDNGIRFGAAEFVLKIALYCRQELNIRTTANFMLACAAFHNECRPFLKKYFRKAVLLPSDWIDVAEMYQVFADKRMMWGALPSALRKAMDEKFSDFDEYQLAKYNKDKNKLKKKKEKRQKSTEGSRSRSRRRDNKEAPPAPPAVTADSDSEDEEALALRSFTLKQLIRAIHIREPAKLVLGLLGKKYPETSEAFSATRLSGTWDSDRAGKRMRLAVPETWETQIASRGNKAEVWQDLIDRKKLPFMAMLRNLRNMIRVGISEKHHQNNLKRLTDQKTIANSRQFPFRFFSAYSALDDLETDFNKNESALVSRAVQQSFSGRRGRGGSRGRGRGRGRGGSRSSRETKPEESRYDIRIIERYRTALNTAVKLAAQSNVPPVPGRTLVLCDLSRSTPCTSFSGMGRPRTVREVAALVSLMCCQVACESSTLLFFESEDCAEEFEPEKVGIMQNMEKLTQRSLNIKWQSTEKPLRAFFQEILMTEAHFDTVLFVGAEQASRASELGIHHFVGRLRERGNPRMLFVSNLFSAERTPNIRDAEGRDVIVCGYSDQLLRFLAQKGNARLLDHVEAIDRRFDLPTAPLPCRSALTALLEQPAAPAWRQIGVFVSSTFLDMHGERDLLTRFVFPRLRAKMLRRYGVDVLEVDLRWGLRREPQLTDNAVLECLRQVRRCEVFLGLLGQRYGSVPNSYGAEKAAADMDLHFEHRWLDSYPADRSMTELEVAAAVLHRYSYNNPTRALFFERSEEALRDVPKALRSSFCSEGPDSLAKLKDLRARIIEAGYPIAHYSAAFGGVFDSRPMMRELEDFAGAAFTALERHVIEIIGESEENEQNQSGCSQAAAMLEEQRRFVMRESDKFQGVSSAMKELMGGLRKGAVGKPLLLTGEAGTGKTAVLAHLADCLSEAGVAVVAFFASASPQASGRGDLLEFLLFALHKTFDLRAAGLQPPARGATTEQLERAFREALDVIGTRGFLHLFLDGLDQLDNSEDLSFLPDVLPSGLRVVVSATKGSEFAGRCARRCEGTRVVPPLDARERSALVREELLCYGKTLEESAFSNQMKFVTGKRESKLPLFLAIACDELRLVGVLEKLDDRLRELPQSLPELLREKITRVEIDNGAQNVRLLLALLENAEGEIAFSDACALLALGKSLSESPKPEVKDIRSQLATATPFPHVQLLQLITALQFLLRPNDDARLRLSRSFAARLVLAGAGLGALRSLSARLLAAISFQLCDPKGDGSFEGRSDPTVLSQLPLYLIKGECWSELRELLTSLPYVAALSEEGELGVMLRFGAHKEMRAVLDDPKVSTVQHFVRSNYRVLHKHPQLLLQQSANAGGFLRDAARALLRQPAAGYSAVVLERCGPSQPDPISLRFMDAGPCSALAARDEGPLALGFESGAILLLQGDSAEVLRSISGHGAPVTSLCFLSSSVLASASEDGAVALWEISSGIRLAFDRSAHASRVSGLAVWDGQCVSVGWDHNLRVVSPKAGARPWSTVLKSQVNAVSACPDAGAVIALGLWSGSIMLFNLSQRARAGMLHGHATSVQFVSHAPGGHHLASAALDGEIRLWDIRRGVPVGRFQPRAPQPLGGIAFSGRHLLAAFSCGRLRLWDAELGTTLTTFAGKSSGDSPDSSDPIASCAVFPESEASALVALGRHSGRIEVWDRVKGRLVSNSAEFHVARIVGLAWSRAQSNQRRFLLTASEDRTLKVILCSEKGDLVDAVASFDSDSAATCLAWQLPSDGSLENSFCAAGRANGVVELRQMGADFSSDRVWLLRDHSAKVTAVAMLERMQFLASSSIDRSLAIYRCSRVASGKPKPVVQLSKPHSGAVTAIAWDRATAPTGSDPVQLCTAGDDGEVKVWKLSGVLGGTGVLEQLRTLAGHLAPVVSLDCQAPFLVSGDTSGIVKVWTLGGALITTRKLEGGASSCRLLLPASADEPSCWANVTVLDESAKDRRRREAAVARGELMTEEAPNLQLLMTAGSGEAALICPLRPNLAACLPAHSAPVRGVQLSSSRALSCAADGSFGQVDLSCALQASGSSSSEVTCLASLPRAAFFVTGDASGCLALHFGVRTASVRLRVAGAGSISAVAMARSREGTIEVFFASGLVLFRLAPANWSCFEDGAELSGLEKVKLPHPACGLLAMPDGLVVSLWSGKLLELKDFDLARMKDKGEWSDAMWVTNLRFFNETVFGVARDHCGGFGVLKVKRAELESAKVDSHLMVWPPATRGEPAALAFSDSARFLLVASSASDLLVFDKKAPAYPKLLQLSCDEAAKVTAMAIVHEGEEKEKRLAVAVGYDSGDVCVWRVDLKSAEVSQVGLLQGASPVTVLHSSAPWALTVGDSHGEVASYRVKM